MINGVLIEMYFEMWSEVLSYRYNCSMHKLQVSRDGAINSKLHAIKPTLGEWTPSYRTILREEVVIAKIRIGHTYITHSHILKGEDPPECVSCNELFTVKHFMTTCSDRCMTRDKYYNVHDMKDFFDTI